MFLTDNCAGSDACMQVKGTSILLFGVSGSPKEGATAYAVKEALRYAKEKFNVETKYFSVRNKDINFCLHCDYCIREKKGCIQNDDLKPALNTLTQANAVIFSTPVYQGTISAQLKTFFDRCRSIVAINPDVLKNLLDEKLVDYVAMDVKAPFEFQKYSKAIGFDSKEFLDMVKKSVKLYLDKLKQLKRKQKGLNSELEKKLKSLGYLDD